MNSLGLSLRVERWPIAGTFSISRGAKTEAVVVVAELSDGTRRGRGECVPYARYGEAVEGVAAAIEAKRARRPVHELLGMPAPKAVTTAYTISLGTPEAMARAAAGAGERALLKVKLGAPGDPARIAAVRHAAPRAELIVDANEGWTESGLAANLAACAEAAVTLIEQPLPAEHDDALARIAHPLPICADESAHASASLSAIVGKYDAVNIKLDKTGGLTEALAMAREAERLGLTLMVGCMVATSLAMAPAMLLAQRARVVDLDGPLLLARDRLDGLRYEHSRVHPAAPALWG